MVSHTARLVCYAIPRCALYLSIYLSIYHLSVVRSPRAPLLFTLPLPGDEPT